VNAAAIPALALGVCYYPEQWSRTRWRDDALQMKAMGLTVVRIAEFAWSRMEPAEGCFDWAWLDEAIETLAGAGLRIVLGTPTAAPPTWLLAAHPEIAPVDATGRVKRAGSRRHYCFSSPALHGAARRIVDAMARRYGPHPSVVAWQVDNEYGCHDTTFSYSPAALEGFRQWLRRRYGSVAELNEAWGTDFWGQQLDSFDAVDFPVGQPADPLPCHALDWQRFASDEVVRFNRLQVELIRQHAPDRPVLHNFMGLFADIDPHAVARDLDLAAWDSYPLGHTEVAPFLSDEDRNQWARTGHPDLTAFHHDLYRGVGHGRLWVMEQQAGPVNWAPWNALPLPGMVRAWTWEAFAHGAEMVSYFRWRQLPYGQEQMHSGLNRPNGEPDVGALEAAEVAREVCREVSGLTPSSLQTGTAPVALVLDMPSMWMARIQPQGADMAGFGAAVAYYAALRRRGLDVDIVGPDADLGAYPLIVLPAALHVGAEQRERLQQTTGVVVCGPRVGSKSATLALSDALPLGPMAPGLPMRVLGVESLRPGRAVSLQGGGQVHQWRDLCEALDGTEVLTRDDDGWPAWLQHGRWHAHASRVDDDTLEAWLAAAARQAGLMPLAAGELPPGLRLRRRGDWQFAINRGPGPARVPAPEATRFVIGGRHLPPGGVAAWQADTP
jgi:beta-galactosidase